MVDGLTHVMTMADDRHWGTFHTCCETVPHRSTPQRLLVVLGRVEICGSGVSGRRASDAAGRVQRTS